MGSLNRRSKGLKRAAMAVLGALLFLGAAETFYRASRFAQARLQAWRSGGYDLYAVGGSVATGYPYSPPVAFPNAVSLMFGGSIGGRRIMVQTVASPGNTLVSDHFYLRQMLSYRRAGAPGAALIYAGRAEPDAFSSHPRLARVLTAAQRGILGRSLLAADALFYLERAWQAGGDPLPRYEEALRGIVADCLKAGVTPIVATPLADKSGFEPVPTEPLVHDPRFTPELLRGAALERRGDYAGAARLYARLLGEFSQETRPLKHRLCRCLYGLGKYDAAKACFAENAAGYGDPGERARIAAQVARDYGVPLIDSEALFESRSPHGVAGNELFDDAGHPNLEGQLLLASAFAELVPRPAGEPIRRRFDGPEDLLRSVSYPRASTVCGLVGAGYLALRDAPGQPYLPQRVAFAADHFKKALALMPEDGPALLGLGLTEAAARANDTVPALDFLRLDSAPSSEAAGGGTECVRACLALSGPGEARDRLRSAGVPEALADKIAQAVPSGCR